MTYEVSGKCDRHKVFNHQLNLRRPYCVKYSCLGICSRSFSRLPLAATPKSTTGASCFKGGVKDPLLSEKINQYICLITYSVN